MKLFTPFGEIGRFTSFQFCCKSSHSHKTEANHTNPTHAIKNPLKAALLFTGFFFALIYRFRLFKWHKIIIMLNLNFIVMNLKKTLSKIYKTGFFHSFVLNKNMLLFKDCFNNVYSLFPYGNFFLFRIGHVEQWEELGPTYESEYSSIGKITRSKFIDHVTPVITDNPDYVLRFSKAYLFGE